MDNLSEDIQCAGFDTRPPMLDRTDIASWQQRIRLYCRGKENGVNILMSIDEGQYQMGTVREPLAEGTEGAPHLGPERHRVYSDLSPEEKDRMQLNSKFVNNMLPEWELEELKLEKDGLDGKLAGPLKASKNLDHLIESQRFDQVKEGVGYNAVPPPAADLYLSPKKDLSWTCLPEFVDDTVIDYSKPTPNVASTSAEGQNKDSSTSEDVASPKPPKPFVKTNGEALRKCILSGPYKPTTVLVDDVEATDNSPAVAEHTTVETPANMSPENKAHFLAEKEAIHLILTGIGDDIYSTVDACQTAQEMSHRSSAPSPKPSIPSRSHTSTRHKGKEIAKTITPPSETASEEDSDPEQAQRDKDMQKNLALIAKYFRKIYKPTNNNLRTSSNSKNKNVDTTSRYKNDDHSGQFGTQRTVNVVGPREKVGSPVVQKSGIQCFNCKEYGHFSKECRKPKRVKDSAYHKEKMLLCKQAEQGVPLHAEQYDWLADTDEEVDEQELEAHYSYMAKIQEVPTAESGTDSELVEQVQNNVGYNVFANALQHSEQSESNDQNDVESNDERVALANLIANLKLDVDENKKIQNQLKKANTTLAQELKECKTILAKTNKSLGESISVRDSCLVALQTKQTEFEKYKAFNDRTVDYDKLKRKLNEALGQLAHKDTGDSLKFVHELKQEMHANLKYVESLEKAIDELGSKNAEFSDMYDVILHDCVSKDVMCSYLMSLSDLDALDELQCLYLHKVKECDCLAQKLSNQTESVSKEVHNELLKHFAKVEKHSISLEIALQKHKEQNIAISELKKLIENGKGKSVDTKFDRPSIVRQPNAQRIPKPSVLGTSTPFSNSLDRIYFQKTRSVPKANMSKGLSKPVTAQTLSNTAKKAVSNTNVLKPGMYRIDNRIAHTKTPQLPQTVRNTNPRVSTFTGVNHKRTVSRPQLKRNQSRDKVLPNNSQVKLKKTQVEVHPRNPSVSNKMKSVTAFKDNLNSRTLNDNAVCATCNKCLVDSNHFSYVTKMLNDVHARTKKPNIVQLILFIVDSGCTKHMTENLKLLCNFVEKFLGTVRFAMISLRQLLVMEIWFKEMSRSTGFTTSKASITISSQLVNFVMRIWRLLSGSLHVLLEIFRTTPTQAWLWHRILSHLNFDYINLLSKKDIVIGLPKMKYVKDQLCSSCELSKAKRSSFKSKAVPSSKGRLNLLHIDLCGPMRIASINGKKYILVIVDDYSRSAETSVANNTLGLVPQQQKASDYDNHNPVPQRQDVYSSADADVPLQQELDMLFGPLYDEFFNASTNPSTTIPSTLAPLAHTNMHAEENNNDQAEEGEHVPDDEFTNPFCTPVQEVAETSSHNIDGNPSRANIKQALGRRSYALSWKPCQGDSLNLPDHRVVVQNVQGRQNRGQRMNPQGGGAPVYGGVQNRVGNANSGQERQAQENRVALDAEQLLFLEGGQDNAIDDDVDEQPVQDLALNVDNVFQAKDCDAFDSNVDEAPTAQTMFMANLSSADPVTDEAEPSYDSDILSELQDHDHYQDVVCTHHEEHTMHDNVQLNHDVDSHADHTSDSNMILYDQYVKDNAVPVVHSNVSSVPNDAFMMIYNDMYEPHAQSVSNTSRNLVVDNSLTAELVTYKEQVELPKPYYNELNKVAIGYKNPLCLTRAKQVPPALYNGHEIIKDNHVPAIVHNTKDTLEIAEITRKKMNDKMKDPECVTRKYKFPQPVKVVATVRRLEMPLPEVCTAIEEKKKKLPVKDRWQLH
nr:retrovirus-related Pol polyprotein from transposon TNT 1-94 [Tanacetum cinerariifolium]